MLRKIGALVAGVVVVGVVVGTLQAFGVSLHPLPEGIDPLDPADAEAFAAHLERMPPLSWAIAFGSELLGALLGALAAGWIARDRVRLMSGAIVGVALAGSLVNWTAFEHPMWFMVGQLAGYPFVLTTVWALLGERGPAGGAVAA